MTEKRTVNQTDSFDVDDIPTDPGRFMKWFQEKIDGYKNDGWELQRIDIEYNDCEAEVEFQIEKTETDEDLKKRIKDDENRALETAIAQNEVKKEELATLKRLKEKYPNEN